MGYGVINPDGVTLEFTDPENGKTFHFPPDGEERLDVDILLNAKSITVSREFGLMEWTVFENWLVELGVLDEEHAVR